MRFFSDSWRYVRSYRFKSMFIRYFLLALALIILPLASLGVLVMDRYTSIVNEEIQSLNAQSLSKVRDMVDLMLREADSQSSSIVANQHVEWFILFEQNKYPAMDVSNRTRAIYELSNLVARTSDFIRSILIYSEKNDYVISSSGSGKLDLFLDRSWEASYRENKESSRYWAALRLYQDPLSGQEGHYLSIYRTVSLFGQGAEGVVIFNVDLKELGRLIDADRSPDSTTFYVVNADHQILYSRDEALLEQDIRRLDAFEQHPSDGNAYSKIITGAGPTRVVSFAPSEYRDWGFFSVTPMGAYGQKLQGLRQFLWAIVAVGSLIAVGLAFVASLNAYKPIRRILSLLEAPGEWVKTEQQGESSNELKFIVSNIQRTITRKDMMEEELEHRLQLLRTAQAVALQSQINPHFLYNTLETANWLAIGLTGGDNDVSTVLASLAQLLRLSLDTEEHLVPLATEIRHAKLYLDIQNTRHRDRFRVDWEMEDGLEDCRIVKLVLQPIIENALYHGVIPSGKAGRIVVKGQAVQDELRISVMDEGVGMSAGEVAALNESMQKEHTREGRHIGLKNVNQRIKLIFGPPYGVHVASTPGEGTSVTLVIPLIHGEPGQFDGTL